MTLGIRSVEKEIRIDFEKLRKDRLNKIKESLKKSDCGSLLFFDFDNIRYTTSTTIGEWSRDKLSIYCLLPKDKDPILFTVGSAVPLKREYCPWMGNDNIRVSNSSIKGAIPPEVKMTEKLAAEIYSILKEQGLEKEPVGIDISDYPTIRELQEQGLKISDGQNIALNARIVKTNEEIKLIDTACGIADSGFYDAYNLIRPGVRENEIVAMINKKMFERGCDLVECVNVESGERTNPHHHEFSDRLIRPGDVVYIDIMTSFMGYRTCYYRTFFVGKPSKEQKDAYKLALQWLQDSVDSVKAGKTTGDLVKNWPKAEDFGWEDEEIAMDLQVGHGVGLNLYERPLMSRLFSFKYPYQLVENNVLALETFNSVGKGRRFRDNGVRIEEMVQVTKEGSNLLTKYPIADLDALTCW